MILISTICIITDMIVDVARLARCIGACRAFVGFSLAMYWNTVRKETTAVLEGRGVSCLQHDTLDNAQRVRLLPGLSRGG
jgi:hypothetical protein